MVAEYVRSLQYSGNPWDVNAARASLACEFLSTIITDNCNKVASATAANPYLIIPHAFFAFCTWSHEVGDDFDILWLSQVLTHSDAIPFPLVQKRFILIDVLDDSAKTNKIPVEQSGVTY